MKTFGIVCVCIAVVCFCILQFLERAKQHRKRRAIKSHDAVDDASGKDNNNTSCWGAFGNLSLAAIIIFSLIVMGIVFLTGAINTMSQIFSK